MADPLRRPYLQDFIVACNCGARALVLFDPATRTWAAAPVFAAQGWNFDVAPSDLWPFGRGWNCGKAYDPVTGRHWQRRTEGKDRLATEGRYRQLIEELANGDLQC